MPVASRTATFAAPLPVVWETLVDPSWSGSWFGAETSITQVSGRGIGARQEITASLKGAGVSLVIETTKYEQGRILTQQLVEVGGKAIEGMTELSCELSPHGTGTTVTVTSSVPDSKGLIRRMLGLGRAHLEASAAQRTLKHLERLAIERADISPESGRSEQQLNMSSNGEPPRNKALLSSEIPAPPPQEEMPGLSDLGPDSLEPVGPQNDPTHRRGRKSLSVASTHKDHAEIPGTELSPQGSAIEVPEAPPMPDQPDLPDPSHRDLGERGKKQHS